MRKKNKINTGRTGEVLQHVGGPGAGSGAGSGTNNRSQGSSRRPINSLVISFFPLLFLAAWACAWPRPLPATPTSLPHHGISLSLADTINIFIKTIPCLRSSDVICFPSLFINHCLNRRQAVPPPHPRHNPPPIHSAICTRLHARYDTSRP